MFVESRRTFFKNCFLTTAVMVMSADEVFASVTPLQTLSLVQDDLFPKAKIIRSNASAYISVILNHTLVTDEDKQFLRDGVKWLNEEAVTLYKKIYTQLTPQQRQNTLQTISKQRWGKNWIDTVLKYIMEAMLGDPIYGINKDESGWQWLHHKGGLPRPKEALL